MSYSIIIRDWLIDIGQLSRLTIETYDEFQGRAIMTIHSIPKQTIDKNIASSRDRLLVIIENGGERTKKR